MFKGAFEAQLSEMWVWELAKSGFPFILGILFWHCVCIEHCLCSDSDWQNLSEYFKVVSGSNPQRLLINNWITPCLYQRVLKTELSLAWFANSSCFYKTNKIFLSNPTVTHAKYNLILLWKYGYQDGKCLLKVKTMNSLFFLFSVIFGQNVSSKNWCFSR